MEDADTHSIACSPVHMLRCARKFSEKPGATHPLCYSDPSYEMGLASCSVDKKSYNINTVSCQTLKMMRVSKAFRCVLPPMREDQLTNLRRWAELHCAQSIVFRDDRGSAVFVGLKAELRTCASFSRTVRTALRRLCIDVPLRGRWCVLITPREALSVCASECAFHDAALPSARGADASPCAEDDNDVRVVALTPSSRPNL